MGDVSEVVKLGEKWIGGTVLLQPKDTSLKPKEIPIDIFFHKIVMARDRLRVLEQNINSHKKLTERRKNKSSTIHYKSLWFLYYV